MELFRFDRAKAAKSIENPDGALWPVNAYSDADELNDLLEAALASGVIARDRPRAHIYVYPLSICEPEPLLAVDPGAGPTLLGYSMKLREGEGETQVESTLRLLEELTAEANALASGREAASAAEVTGTVDDSADSSCLSTELTERIGSVLGNDEPLGYRRREIVRSHLAAQDDCPACGGSGEGPIASEQECDHCEGRGFLKRPPDRLADDLKDWCEGLVGLDQPDDGQPHVLARELLTAVLARVDWCAIARRCIAEEYASGPADER
jgi:hypothetical protein